MYVCANIHGVCVCCMLSLVMLSCYFFVMLLVDFLCAFYIIIVPFPPPSLSLSLSPSLPLSLSLSFSLLLHSAPCFNVQMFSQLKCAVDRKGGGWQQIPATCAQRLSETLFTQRVITQLSALNRMAFLFSPGIFPMTQGFLMQVLSVASFSWAPALSMLHAVAYQLQCLLHGLMYRGLKWGFSMLQSPTPTPWLHEHKA